MKPGDLIQDMNDDEIGLVVAAGPGYVVLAHEGAKDYPGGIMPSWKINWPSITGLCELAEDALLEGLVEIIHEA